MALQCRTDRFQCRESYGLGLVRLEYRKVGERSADLLVTHDEEFATATTTTTWHLEDGTLTKA